MVISGDKAKSCYNNFPDISIADILLDMWDASPSTNNSKIFNVRSVFEMWSMVSLLQCRVTEVWGKKDEIIFVS